MSRKTKIVVNVIVVATLILLGLWFASMNTPKNFIVKEISDTTEVGVSDF